MIKHDGQNYKNVEDTPRWMLEQHYMAQMHCLISLVRMQGGRITIPADKMVDNPPKRFRLWFTEEEDKSVTIEAREVEDGMAG